MDNKKEEQQQKQQQYNNNQFIKGAFLTLKAAGLTDPSDDEKYSNLNGNVMRSQGLLMIFSLFWARMWEVGNFPIPTKNRWLYYGGCVFLPSIFHVGYISILRVSGHEAYKSLRFLNPKINEDQQQEKQQLLQKLKIRPKQALLRKIYNIDYNFKKDIIDQALILYFPGPNSYTGEDIIEFHLHGSKAIQNKMLQQLSQINNYRLADPGEFTQRALLNEKLDLYEVEALSDVLSSETEYQRLFSSAQFLGQNKQVYSSWKQKISLNMAYIEALIDFEETEADIENNTLQLVHENVLEICKEMEVALQFNNISEIVKEGIKITIIGSPNAGKSSLLNILSKRDAAIISNIPGTTRDIVQVDYNIDGIYCKLYDTAGLRESIDIIENEGIKKALKQAQESHVIIELIDGEIIDQFEIRENKLVFFLQPQQDKINFNSTQNDNKIHFRFINKLDILDEKIQNLINLNNQEKNVKKLQIYIKEEDGKEIPIDNILSTKFDFTLLNFTQTLKSKIQQTFYSFQNGCNNDISQQQQIEQQSLIANQRQRNEVDQCLQNLKNFLEYIEQRDKNTEFIDVVICAEYLRSALYHIGKIQGRVDNEDSNNNQQYAQTEKERKLKSQNCDPNQEKKLVIFDNTYIKQNYKESLVRDYFDDRPCEYQIKHMSEQNKNFFLKWVFSPHQINYSSFKEGQQLVNHIQKLETIQDKSLMVETLENFDKFNKLNNQQTHINSSQFLPETYTINLQSQNFSDKEKQFFDIQDKGLWISKPTNQFGGQGIQIIRDLHHMQEQLKSTKLKDYKNASQLYKIDKNQKIVLQKYIENPMLIEGKKFDIRSYVFIASTKPKYVALYHDGFIRRALHNYTLDTQKGIDDKQIHLTNVFTQSKDSNYKEKQNSLMMSQDEFYNYFVNQAGFTDQQYQNVQKQIREISAYIIAGAQRTLTNKKGYFQVLGFDFMLDENLKVYLIEINKSPSWQILNEKQQFKKEMLHSFIDLVMDLFENEQNANLDKYKNHPSFDLIVNEYENYYAYKDEKQ
ncbi:P-loop containing nucleoside triphosphate hydrolase [Pseudocohnilembus persalinus]|uniref:p-loop containing nucleoside triphosphate hydrolase n=1 Tax=Pseudocohnilembus persalinus TaxID=266149 RepID=A0A0V0QPI4_PSEPJ|nr:P-loop containing nucleoside triphosphate hydrolase [Pseudocohnilembus persalinus]|eukprot:KRX03994.1 P-loop containing nucleoside triphosphate hydrolase [Pseudocohnilembus persalinus]